MKKPYSKPQITFENFELSQSIAYGCTYMSNHQYGVCALDTDIGLTIFTEKPTCEYTQAPGDNDGVCYDVPNDDSRVFSS